MKARIIIKKPIITEKSMSGTEGGKYTFEVARNANKIEITRAIEEIFGVKVKAVRISNLPAKKRTRGKTVGRVPGSKKAYVTLASGKIDIFGKV